MDNVLTNIRAMGIIVCLFICTFNLDPVFGILYKVTKKKKPYMETLPFPICPQPSQ